LGAPDFFGDADGVCSGVALGVGEGVSDGGVDLAGVSSGSGEGEAFFFFRCGEALGEGVAEICFFLGVGDHSSAASSPDGICFFFGEGVADGLGEDFFDGLGVGVGDLFFVIAALFFFRGFGVGVGVAKSFLIASPTDCSARPGATCANKIEMMMKKRSSMRMVGRRRSTIS
jgi:hypothetical protein